MNEISRREILQGIAVTAAAAAIPSAATADLGAAIGAVEHWVEQKTWKLHYVVRYLVNPVFQPSFKEGDRVQIKFKSNKRDTRSFAAASLETGEGKVRHVIPPGAVPWRYVRSRWREAPVKFHRKIERDPNWTRPGTGRLYVVGTKHGWAIVPARRMRALVPPKVALPSRDRNP